MSHFVSHFRRLTPSRWTRRSGAHNTVSRLASAGLAALLAVGMTTVGAAPAQADPEPAAASLPTCQRPLIIAARGSEEPYLPPFLVGYQDPSLGWAGVTLLHFLAVANVRDADIIALNPDEYPAIAVGDLKNVPNGNPTPLDYSITRGVASTIAHHDEYVREHGCQPKTVLLGYSQGAIVMQRAERAIAERGNLAGVIYFGNPLRSANDPAVIGAVGNRVGLQTYLEPSENSLKYRAAHDVVDFCIPLDPVCDQPGRGEEGGLAVTLGDGALSIPLPRSAADLTNPIIAFPFHTSYFSTLPPSNTYEGAIIARLHHMLYS